MFHQSLNWFDYAIIIVITLSIIISFFRGFIREAISLVTWVLAIILALKFAAPLSGYLEAYVKSEMLRYIIAFAVIAILVLIVGVFINALLHFAIRKLGSGISLTDRFLGIFFGAARGVLAVAVVLLFINLSSLKKQEYIKESQLAPHFQVIVDWLDQFLPKKMQQVSAWLKETNSQI